MLSQNNVASKTKYNIDNDTVIKIFEAAGISDVRKISPLGAGEFNTVLAVSAGGKNYALKIAPSPDTEVLPYEHNMMRSEVYWYGRMQKDTDINVPQIYFSDFTRTIIPCDYFIMEKLDGLQPDKMNLSKAEKIQLAEGMAKMTAQMHKVKGDKFGYIQSQSYDSWYDAIRNLTISLIDSCAAKGRKTRRGCKLLRYIDKYKNILESVECRMVNYDIWVPNILAERENGKLNFWWIDPERCFWGDRMADFVCLEFMKPLKKKISSLNAYNSVADDKLVVTRETEIRYAVLMCYMGLIQETEKYYRYSPKMFGWWRNIISCALMFYKTGFRILKDA